MARVASACARREPRLRREQRPRREERPVGNWGRAALALLLVALLALTACAPGNDAAVFGGSFTFVSPGGETEFSYPVAERGTVGDLSGPDLSSDGTSPCPTSRDPLSW